MWSILRWLRALAVAFALTFIPIFPALAAPPSLRFSDQIDTEYPTEMPSIAVSVVRDGLDSRGHWQQTVRLRIGPGGTLVDASLVAYGDVTHVEAIFKAAQRVNPRLYSPAMVPVGQQIDLTIDPSTTFVLETVLHGSNTLVQRFTNGTVNTNYLKPNGSLRRAIAFPDGKPTEFFTYPSQQGPIKVRPGGRIVDVQYAKGQSFADLVKQTYDVTTYAAAVDLTKQTGWDPTRWPPPAGAQKRVITNPSTFYAAVPKEVALIPNSDPIGRARQEALHQDRLRAGIYAVRQESFGTVYHVAVTDPSLTASQLSYLLYGSPAHRLDVARKAGYQVPRDGAGAAHFDPHLLGRSFDLAVDYQDEQFTYRQAVDSRGVVQLALVDGTEVTDHPSSSHGVLQVVSYPTGYKRIVYRPSKISLMVAQGLGLFHVASDVNLSSDVANAIARDYAARFIWQWSPGMPRSAGDIADSVQLVDDPAGPIVKVLVGPPVPRTVVGDVIDTFGLENPLFAAIGLVVFGVTAILVVDFARRYARRPRRYRW